MKDYKYSNTQIDFSKKHNSYQDRIQLGRKKYWNKKIEEKEKYTK